MLRLIGFPWYMSDKRDFMLYRQNSLEVLPTIPDCTVDMIFADPPYFLSNGGSTCQSGKRVAVHKGEWDQSSGATENHEFNLNWLRECKRILKPDGTMFVSGTHHVIFSIGFAMQQLDMKILNDITWFKVNPPPNLACRYFTHATESIIWAAPSPQSRHYFDYHAMKEENGGKQMQSIWSIQSPRKHEKRFGRHPTQKPLELLMRIVRASTRPGDLVLDPFSGSGTTGIACALLDRRFMGIELDPEYLGIAKQRYLTLDEELHVEERAKSFRKPAPLAARTLKAPSPEAPGLFDGIKTPGLFPDAGGPDGKSDDDDKSPQPTLF
ncbi:site-specific DNA-methyltransferase [Myxococcota bacterium]|jgi:site-specific DNA-methyltransferase (adenine-specific)|nr:site-specific DNA-methyltransferase [Myxococcota bacterium]MBU1512308.1 site-specific DNA-methyltransferase [Myxococcota bacterium]PKN22809.1 MAG: site-specific DNA-methyltransferase [Deltaproteobacteria bacterium HGW-Deltaproteobacteria-22]